LAPRFSLSAAAMISVSSDLGLDDDLPRDPARARVVLEQELRGHHADPVLLQVLQVERLAVGQHARRGSGRPARWRPRPPPPRRSRRACPSPRWRSAGAGAGAGRPAGGCAPAPPARSPARPRRAHLRVEARARSPCSGPFRNATTPSIDSRYSSGVT
jgi:hypothetical protein